MYDEKPGEARRAFRLHGGETAACPIVEKRARENKNAQRVPKTAPAAECPLVARNTRGARPPGGEDLLENACAHRPFRRGKSPFARRKPHFNWLPRWTEAKSCRNSCAAMRMKKNARAELPTLAAFANSWRQFAGNLSWYSLYKSNPKPTGGSAQKSAAKRALNNSTWGNCFAMNFTTRWGAASTIRAKTSLSSFATLKSTARCADTRDDWSSRAAACFPRHADLSSTAADFCSILRCSIRAATQPRSSNPNLRRSLPQF